MANETKQSFPGMPVGSFWKLRKKFKQSIPNTISANYLATTLDMTPAAASNNVMPSLKLLGIVDNDGKVDTDRVGKLRDDEQFPQFCKEVLKEIYPTELLDLFPTMPEDRSSIKKWFMRQNKVGENAAGKFASVFGVLLNADPKEPLESKKTKTATKTTTKDSAGNDKKQTSRASAIRGGQAGGTNVRIGDVTPPVPPEAKNPELHINVQIHISAEASDDQIEKIFESMGKNLFGR